MEEKGKVHQVSDPVANWTTGHEDGFLGREGKNKGF